MPNVYQPGLIQIRTRYDATQPDEQSTPENVLWFVATNLAAFPLTAIQLASIMSTFDPLWASFWKIDGNPSSHYDGSISTDWSVSTGNQATSVGVFTPVAGTCSGIAGAQMARLISLQAVGMPKYRGGHPRIYLPQLGTGNMNDAYTFTTASGTSMTTAMNNLVTGMQGVTAANGGPYTQVIYRERTNPAAAHIYNVTHFVVQQRIATQRRRLRKAPHH